MRHGFSSTPDSAQCIAGSLNTAIAISISSRSTPLSSPRSIFSGSSPLINGIREHVWPEKERHLDRDDPNSDSEVAEEIVRSPTPPSASSNEASRPGSAATDRSAFPSSSTTLPVPESLEESSTWTRKRLRPKSEQAVAIRQEHPTEDRRDLDKRYKFEKITGASLKKKERPDSSCFIEYGELKTNDHPRDPAKSDDGHQEHTRISREKE